jgi:V/A-type H+-transporting ATPase subunit A
MTVVGEEGTSIEDFTTSLKADFFDNVYLQQNAFDKVDAATPAARQKFVFDRVLEVCEAPFEFASKDDARRAMVAIGDLFRNWNYAAQDSQEYKRIFADIEAFMAKHGAAAEAAS